MSRITRNTMLMGIAQIVARRGTCDRLQVGAIISRDSRVVAMGYNGAPSGQPHCDHNSPASWAVPKDIPCNRAVHAEINAILFAARYGISVEGCDMYTTATPCLPCAQAIINSGIKCIWYDKMFSRSDGYELLVKSGMRIEHAFT